MGFRSRRRLGAAAHSAWTSLFDFLVAKDLLGCHLQALVRGQESIVALMEAGDLFGEMSLFDDELERPAR